MPLEESQIFLKQCICVSVTQVMTSDSMSLGDVPEIQLSCSWDEDMSGSI